MNFILISFTIAIKVLLQVRTRYSYCVAGLYKSQNQIWAQ